MKRVDAQEAAGIIDRMMQNLATTVAVQGRTGADARTAINDVRANAFFLCMADQMGQPLADAFDAAREAGATLPTVDNVRRLTEQETPKTLGGTLVRDCGICLCFATIGYIIADMTFVSRQDVDRLKYQMLQPFAEAEEIAADSMDSESYKAIISLHAAISNHLTRTALPLPRMVNYAFFEPLPSLVVSYRLYEDASRADEIRAENKIVHPAFCPTDGEALSV